MRVIELYKKADRVNTFLTDKISEEMKIEFKRLRIYAKYNAGRYAGVPARITAVHKEDMLWSVSMEMATAD